MTRISCSARKEFTDKRPLADKHSTGKKSQGNLCETHESYKRGLKTQKNDYIKFRAPSE